MPPLAVDTEEIPSGVVESFLTEVRKQYTNRKIDSRIHKWFGGAVSFTTEEIVLEQPEDFLFFLLGTIRGTEKDADYTVDFRDGNTVLQGYSLPRAVFTRKTGDHTGQE